MGIFKSKKAKEIPRPVVKRGLLVGINYRGTPFQLYGCINDTDNLRQFLTYNRYFKQDELLFMTDDQTGDMYPTKTNMMKQFVELVNFANANPDKDVLLFFSYSGHGAYLQDQNSDESDKRDEVLCPVDCDQVGYIRDDDLKSQFVDKLPANVKLTVLIDACHSGTVLDLRYHYLKTKKPIINVKSSDTKCQICMVSGCLDNQTSADAWLPDSVTAKYESQGAMTGAFIYNYRDEINYTQLITNMRNWLRAKRFDQIPQLTSGRSIKLTDPFLLSSYDI